MQRSFRLVVRWIPLIGLMAAVATVTSPAAGRDLDGRYKDSPLHDWFEHLASGRGLCCSFADGFVVEDADWQTTTDGKHYRVRIPLSAGGSQMDWADVPDEAGHMRQRPHQDFAQQTLMAVPSTESAAP